MVPVVVSCQSIPPVLWHPIEACPYQDNLAVFRFRLSGNFVTDNRWLSLLQPDEVARANHYRRQEDRHRFAYARAILRILVGRYTNQPPATVRVIAGLNKKPQLAETVGLQVNISHADDWILLAISRESVGVDVEKINPDFQFVDLLPQSFSEQERRLIEADTDPRWLFYQFWTRKEALVKATARGMDDDFCRIPASDGEHRISASLLGDEGNWFVRSFTVADHYPAAVAYRPVVDFPKFYNLDGGVFGD